MVFLISAFQIIGALSERAQQMRPPSNASFTTADRRADGQADSSPRGARQAPSGGAARLRGGDGGSGRPDCAPPLCPPLWLGMWVCQWMGTDQARELMCVRVCQASVLQEVHECKPMRTRVVGLRAVSAWRQAL